MTVFCSSWLLARWRQLIVLVVVGLLGSTGVASAASFNVNDATDAPLANPAGTTCASTDGGSCTLRAAVQAADNIGGSSTISLPTGEYKLTVENPKASREDEPGTGDLDVNEGVSLTVAGAGASASVIDANHIDRAFAVHKSAALSISGVTIENGSQNHAEPSSESSESGYGGAIYNDGALSIENSVLEDNSSYYGGGAVYAGSEASATSILNSTVSHNAAGDEEGGALYVEEGNVTLSGDQITNNSADDEGGAVYVYEYTRTADPITISDTTISHNTAEREGGAVYVEYAGTLTVTDSSLSNNTTDDDAGGAIYDSYSGALTVNSSSFEGNSAGDDDGGAVYDYDTDLSVSGSNFVDNGGCCGGALYIYGTSKTASETITTSTFAGNHASDDDGGAIEIEQGDLQVTGSTFDGNGSSYYGGALYYDSGDGMSLVNDTFDGNTAVEGGAIYLGTTASTGSVELVNDTVARNTGYDGGGIADAYYANSIANTIVADNSGGSNGSEEGGGDCYYGADYKGATADKGGNIDSDGTCFSDTVAGDQTGVNPLLAPLSANGGPTLTDALLPNSPAIGHGLAAFCPREDQRGVARSASSCDVGAYQTEPADLAVTVSGPATATQGDAVVYTVTVKDNGPGSTGGVSLTDSLPAGTSLYSVVASQGSCAGTSTLTCALGALESGASATVKVTAIANVVGSQIDTASVGGTAIDPNPANNSASATTVVSALPTATTKTTTTAKPQVSTGKASEKTKSSALVSGMVNPGGSATTWRFEIGTSKKKLKRMTPKQSAGSGTTSLGVLALIKGLKPGTRYYVEIVAANAKGTVYGKIVSFKTAGKAPKKHHKSKKKK